MSPDPEEERSPKARIAVLISELLVTTLVVVIKVSDLVHYVGQL